MDSSVKYVFDYLIGLAMFGLVYFILDGPVQLFNTSLSADNNSWVMYLWGGSLVVYLVFGAFYFLNRIREFGGNYGPGGFR